MIMQILMVLAGLAATALVIGLGAGLATRRDGNPIVWAGGAAALAAVTIGIGMALLFASVSVPLALVLLAVGGGAALYAATRMSPPMEVSVASALDGETASSPDDVIPSHQRTVERVLAATRRAKISKRTSRPRPATTSSKV